MKKSTILFIVLMSTVSSLFANGVAIVDAQKGIFLHLVSSQVYVKVENQIAVVTSKEVFKNNQAKDAKVKYAFPMPEDASMTNLKWKIDGVWRQAKVSPVAPDTSLPGGGGGEIVPYLREYLQTPVYFEIEQAIKPDSLLSIEITYVQLLKYELGQVTFQYNNNYQLIQLGPLQDQELEFTLVSSRTIDALELQSSQPIIEQNVAQDSAYVHCRLMDKAAKENYILKYSLSLEELGLSGMSTMLPDSVLPDPWGGFFLFIAEPNLSDTTNIQDKVFTFIIDCSGSMRGTKIEQAKKVAKYIVASLNAGDKFNIVSFQWHPRSFEPQHVFFNPQTKILALQYIDRLTADAGAGTNISEAFDMAVPQFSNTDENTANIILFFTDGIPNGGIENPDALVAHVNSLVQQANPNLALYAFGVGGNVNRRLLTLLAEENNGAAEFIANEQLQSIVANFYNKIRNPALLNTQITFDSPSIREVFPKSYPHLYKGQQLMVTGRYGTPGPLKVTLSGTKFGNPVSFEYSFTLADSAVSKNQFLPKVWAMKKIDDLLVEYYKLPQFSNEAQVLKNQIIEFSVSYGVLSPFTSFQPPATVVNEDRSEKKPSIPQHVELLGNYPNPFNAATTIAYELPSSGRVIIRVYDLTGRLVKVLADLVEPAGRHSVNWDGTDLLGRIVASGIYICQIEFLGRNGQKTVMSMKMSLLK